MRIDFQTGTFYLGDCFDVMATLGAGSGTTAIAAIQSGRRWICIERDEGYFERAIARVWDAEAML